MIAAVKANALNDIPCQQCTDKVAGKEDELTTPTCHVDMCSWASQSGTSVFNTAIARVNKSRPDSKSMTGRVYVDMN